MDAAGQGRLSVAGTKAARLDGDLGVDAVASAHRDETGGPVTSRPAQHLRVRRVADQDDRSQVPGVIDEFVPAHPSRSRRHDRCGDGTPGASRKPFLPRPQMTVCFAESLSRSNWSCSRKTRARPFTAAEAATRGARNLAMSNSQGTGPGLSRTPKQRAVSRGRRDSKKGAFDRERTKYLENPTNPRIRAARAAPPRKGHWRSRQVFLRDIFMGIAASRSSPLF